MYLDLKDLNFTFENIISLNCFRTDGRVLLDVEVGCKRGLGNVPVKSVKGHGIIGGSALLKYIR